MRKHILILLMLLCSSLAYGQQLISFGGSRMTDTAYAARSMRVDSVVRFVRYGTADTNKVVGLDANGFLVLRTKGYGSGGSTDSTVFYTNYRADTSRTLIYGQLATRVKYTDTAAMLLGYVRTARLNDTAAAIRASIPSVTGKVNYTDTAAMLSPYLRKVDTSSLSTRIDARVKYTDTTAMLGNYSNFGKSKTGAGAVVLENAPALILPSISAIQVVGGIAALPTGNGTLMYRGDTTAMLAPYVRGTRLADSTAALRTVIATKQAYTDTTTWDATKKNLADTAAVLRGLMPTGVDTTSLSNRIDARVKYTDTATMLSPYATEQNLADTSAALRALLGSGDVVGPVGATDNAVARYDNTTGKLIQNSGVTIDDNSNLRANNYIGGYTTTATAAGTTTLTAASTILQFFTGVTTQNVNLPDVTTLSLGHPFTVVNNSTGLVTVRSSGSNNIVIMGAGTTACFTCILTTGTTAASWSTDYSGVIVATGKRGTFNNSIAFTGTDNTTMTFPSASATLGGLATTQTWTGANTFNNANILAGAATMAIFNTTVTNMSFAGATTTFAIGGTPTTALTIGYYNNTTASGATKTLNFGLNGASGSTTAFNFGSNTSGATNTFTFNRLLASGTTNDSLVVIDPSTGVLKRISSARIGAGGLSGLTTNNVPKATSSSTIGTSQITDNGTSVGINNASPVASALLQASSTTQGVLFCPMTNAQKSAIASPASGLEVYNATISSPEFYNGTLWTGAWNRRGVDAVAGDYMGTNNAVNLEIKSRGVRSGYFDLYSQNTIYGFGAGVPNTGVYNALFGHNVLTDNVSTAGGVAAFGTNALKKGISCDYTTAMGYSSCENVTTGENNTGFGAFSLFTATTGRYNTANGRSALYALTTGWYNTAVGAQAGDNITTGYRNVNIGYNQKSVSPTADGQLNIAGAIFGTNMTGDHTAPAGQVGILTTAPTAGYALDVNGNVYLRADLVLPALSVYADNTAAAAAGLPVGKVYRTSTGQMMVRY